VAFRSSCPNLRNGVGPQFLTFFAIKEHKIIGVLHGIVKGCTYVDKSVLIVIPESKDRGRDCPALGVVIIDLKMLLIHCEGL